MFDSVLNTPLRQSFELRFSKFNVKSALCINPPAPITDQLTPILHSHAFTNLIF